jgi:hypothetical protein
VINGSFWEFALSNSTKRDFRQSVVEKIKGAFIKFGLLDERIQRLEKPETCNLFIAEAASVVTFPPHDPSDAGSNPAEKFREQVLREGLQAV